MNLKIGFDIDQLLNNGIDNDVQLAEAIEVDKQLRKLAAKDDTLKNKRSQLRKIIQRYEDENWNLELIISDQKIKESDDAIMMAAAKASFNSERKKLIKARLKRLNLNQQELGRILGHNSKSYMSELMNGISPFSIKDLVVIGKLLKIKLEHLIFNQIPLEDREKIELTIKELNKPALKLDSEEFSLV